MDRMSSEQSAAFGLTLIELLIVLLILGVTLAFGGPAMRQLVYGMQVSSEISRLMGAVNLVRSEALRLNQAVTMCPSSMAETGSSPRAPTQRLVMPAVLFGPAKAPFGRVGI